jgi:hypothetical protein
MPQLESSRQQNPHNKRGKKKLGSRAPDPQKSSTAAVNSLYEFQKDAFLQHCVNFSNPIPPNI